MEPCNFIFVRTVEGDQPSFGSLTSDLFSKHSDLMRLVTFLSPDGNHRPGVLIDNDKTIVDIGSVRSELAFSSMISLIRAGKEAFEAVLKIALDPPPTAVIDTSSVELRTPVSQPPQIRDCLCFEEHLLRAYEVLRRNRAAQEPDPEAALLKFEREGLFRVPSVWYQQPIYYKANRLSVIGHDQDVLWPDYAQVMDYELEFGCFIGKAGKDIPPEKARDHIFGYAIFNDFSARDAQMLEMPGGLGPAKGKDFDTGNVIGPCIVTVDELEPYDCTMVARVNGEERSRGTSSSIHWKFEDLIAHISQSETLYPGEFLGSGTVGGGCGLEQERYLTEGDTVELEVEGIGVLRNRIVRSRGNG